MKISQYRKKEFAKGSAPSAKTIRKLIDNGELAGQTLGGLYYVEISETAVGTLARKVLNAS